MSSGSEGPADGSVFRLRPLWGRRRGAAPWVLHALAALLLLSPIVSTPTQAQERRDFVFRAPADTFRVSGEEAGSEKEPRGGRRSDAPYPVLDDSLVVLLDRYLVDLATGLTLELPGDVEPTQVYPYGVFELRWPGEWWLGGQLYEGDLGETSGVGVPRAVLRDAVSLCVGENPMVDVSCEPEAARPLEIADFWDPILAFDLEQRIEEPGVETVTRTTGPFLWISFPPGSDGDRGLLLHPGWGERLSPTRRERVVELIGNLTPPPPAGIVSSRPALVHGDAPIHEEPGRLTADGFLHRGTPVAILGPSLVQERKDAFDIEWHRVEYADGRFWMAGHDLAFLEDETAEAALFRAEGPGTATGSPVVTWYLALWEELAWVTPHGDEEVLFSPSLHHYAVLDPTEHTLRVVDPFPEPPPGVDPEELDTSPGEVLLEVEYRGEPRWEGGVAEPEALVYDEVVREGPGGAPVVEARRFRPEDGTGRGPGPRGGP